MLLTVAVALLALWAIGVLGHIGGGFIHILMIMALVAVLLRVIQGRRLA